MYFWATSLDFSLTSSAHKAATRMKAACMQICRQTSFHFSIVSTADVFASGHALTWNGAAHRICCFLRKDGVGVAMWKKQEDVVSGQRCYP